MKSRNRSSYSAISPSILTSPSINRQPIELLPSSTISLLRSTLTLPQKGEDSLSVVLSELVQNALDAKAKRIEVWINLDQWSLGVADDGVGFGLEVFKPQKKNLHFPKSQKSQSDGGFQISKIDETRPSGRVERYSSSKWEPPPPRARQSLTANLSATASNVRSAVNRKDPKEKTVNKDILYGARGEALASIADLAILEILSQPRQPQPFSGEGRNISSFSTGEEATWSLIMKGEKVLYSGRARKSRPQGFGSTVWARDLFHNLPVRRKALSKTSRGRPHQRIIRSLLDTLTTLALVHPEVAFNATLLSSSTAMVTSNSSNTSSLRNLSSGDSGKLLLKVKSAPPEDFWARWKQLFGEAGVESVFHCDSSLTSPVHMGDGVYNVNDNQSCSIKGFFSLTASHSKLNQYVYVNGYPVPNSAESVIHTSITSIFSRSTFSKYASSHITGGTPSSSPSRLGRSSNLKQAAANGRTTSPHLRRTAEKYPIFMLNITTGEIDVSWEPEKKTMSFHNKETVTALVSEVIGKFLEHAHFTNNSGERTVERVSESDAAFMWPKTSLHHPLELRHELPIHTLSSIAKPSAFHTSLHRSKPPTSEEIAHATKETEDRLTVKALAAFTANCLPNGGTREDDEHKNDHICWTDPTTLQKFIINLKTGNTIPVDRFSGSLDQMKAVKRCRQVGGIDQTVFKRMRHGNHSFGDLKLIQHQDNSERSGDMQDSEVVFPPWLSKTLGNWQNPVFPFSAERPVLGLINAPPFLNHDKSSSARHGLRATIPFPVCPQDSVTLSSDRFNGPGQVYSKERFKTAEFIAQVDRKFLLVRLPSCKESLAGERGSGEDDSSIPADEFEVQTLVMVDQHAADERIRLERYFADYCGDVAKGESVKVFCFDVPRAVVVSGVEAKMIEEYRDEFARWGLEIGVQSETLASSSQVSTSFNTSSLVTMSASPVVKDYVQVYLNTVPDIVADRLCSDEQLVQELIRSHLALLQTRSPMFWSKGSSVAVRKAKTWSSVIRDCPPVIVDLIISKACRSAIMFNDELTPEQCKALLSKLADATYPFQCAHGRPSIFPLANLPSWSKSMSDFQSSSLHRTQSSPTEVNWEKFALN